MIKAVLALEMRTILLSLEFSPGDLAIPFGVVNLIVPMEPPPWPEDRDDVSVNCFGIGCSNAHAQKVIIEDSEKRRRHRDF